VLLAMAGKQANVIIMSPVGYLFIYLSVRTKIKQPDKRTHTHEKAVNIIHDVWDDRSRTPCT